MIKKQIKLDNAEISLLIEGLSIWQDEYEGVKDYEVNDRQNIEKLKNKLFKKLGGEK
jgi:hypothetical protein